MKSSAAAIDASPLPAAAKTRVLLLGTASQSLLLLTSCPADSGLKDADSSVTGARLLVSVGLGCALTVSLRLGARLAVLLSYVVSA